MPLKCFFKRRRPEGSSSNRQSEANVQLRLPKLVENSFPTQAHRVRYEVVMGNRDVHLGNSIDRSLLLPYGIENKLGLTLMVFQH